jgi:hypothetical protein
LATALASHKSGKVAVLDTEGRSSLIYAKKFPFKFLSLRDKYSPDSYISAIYAAEDYGYDVLVIDSLSHAWNGAGGVLEIVDQQAAKMGNNKWAGWSAGRPAQNSLATAIVNTGVHLIATMRSKTQWEIVQGEGKKTEYRKAGLEPIQSDDLEYEFLLSGIVGMDHNLILTKTRMEEFEFGQVIDDLDLFGINLHNWSTSGAPIIRGNWATPENISKLMTELEKKGLAASDIKRITGFEDLKDSLSWNRRYSSGKEAFSRIVGSIGQEESLPPAQPKTNGTTAPHQSSAHPTTTD